LKSITNAVGKKVTYDQYDASGNLLSSTDANNVVTVRNYDERGRLTKVSIGGQAISNTYDRMGQLTKMLLDDGSWVGYEYDSSHRQAAIKDSLGNRIDYELDENGHRKFDRIKDPLGTLRRTIARSMDALGRVQQVTGTE
jgi:YD repeat-containing protein